MLPIIALLSIIALSLIDVCQSHYRYLFRNQEDTIILKVAQSSDHAVMEDNVNESTCIE